MTLCPDDCKRTIDTINIILIYMLVSILVEEMINE